MSDESFNAFPVARVDARLPLRNTLTLRAIELRLHDPHLEPLPNAWYLIEVHGFKYTGEADGDAWLKRYVWAIGEYYQLCWLGRKDEQGNQIAKPPVREEDYRYSQRVYFRIDDANADEALRRRLSNLGYPYEPGDATARKQGALIAFQAAHAMDGLEPTGTADDATLKFLKQAHEEMRSPPRKSDAGAGAQPDQGA